VCVLSYRDAHMSTHRIDARIPIELYREIRKTRLKTSEVVVCALENYLHTDPTQTHTTSYNQDLVTQLRSENLFLREIHSKLMARVVMLPKDIKEGQGDVISPVDDIPPPVLVKTRYKGDSTKKEKKGFLAWFKALRS